MRFMVLVPGSPESEAGEMPPTELLEEMTRYNEELVKAGVMLTGDGLRPTSHGARVRFEGGERTVIDGPFTEIEGDRRRLLGLGVLLPRGGARVAEASPVRRRHRDRAARDSGDG